MATQTQYYNLDKPSYDDVADIEVINANMDKIDQHMRNNADGVNFAKGISSDAYDNSKLYAVGDYCIYDNKLYRCITAIESAEAFNVGKWEQTTVGKEVKQLNSNLSTLGKCKNLLNPTLQTTTQNGITCTNNGDGTYTLNGTASGLTTFILRDMKLDSSLSYKLTGCPLGGDWNNGYSMYVEKQYWGIDVGKGYEITLTDASNLCGVYIRIIKDTVCNNLVFKPMITTDLSATYDDFVPYTGDGDTLTHDVAELKNDLSKKVTSKTTNSSMDMIVEFFDVTFTNGNASIDLTNYIPDGKTLVTKMAFAQFRADERNVISGVHISNKTLNLLLSDTSANVSNYVSVMFFVK